MDEFFNNQDLPEVEPNDEQFDTAVKQKFNQEADEPSTNNIDEDEFISDFDENIEDAITFDDIAPEFKPITYDAPKPEKVRNKGLRIFTSILVLLLVAAISASAGYIASDYKHSSSSSSISSSQKNEAPSIALAEKPSKETSSYTDVANQVNPSIVSIMVYNTSSAEYGLASGVVYSKEGYIVTNDHIYDNVPNAKFLVRLSDGTEVKASYVAGDVRSDLAVLKLAEKVKSLKPAIFGDSDKVELGEEVLALGYPSQYGDSVTLTKGIVSAPKRRVSNTTTNYASTFIQTDATINPGNSGGALCNLYGQVIGITSSKLAGDEYDAVSYAIPTSTMKKVVTALIADGAVSYRAKLGITYSEIGTVTAEINNVPKGVYIGTISTDSGLYNKGFGEGDIITHVNGKVIDNGEVLLDVIDNSVAGNSIELTIYKTSKKTSETVDVKLGQDKGSSSYTTEESKNNTSSNFNFDFGFGGDKNSSSESSGDSSKTFDFPLD